MNARRQGVRALARLAYLLALGVSAIGLVLWKLAVQIRVGADWDAYSFLANAAQWAGLGYGYTEPARPPLISVLATLPLRLGATGPSVIQAVDAALTVGTLLAFYLLFRQRFTQTWAAVGAVALLASPPVWRWIGAGYTDLAAMGLCALALLFVLKAENEDPRWFIAAFPTFLAAGLMRHTAVLFALPLAVAVLVRLRPFRHARWVAAGILATGALLLPFAIYYQRLVGHALYPFIVSASLKDSIAADGKAVSEVASYLHALPTLALPAPLVPATMATLFLGIAGLTVAGVRSLLHRRVSLARIVTAGLLVAACIWAIASVGLIGAVVAVTVGTFGCWRLLATDPVRVEGGTMRDMPAPQALDAAMLAWLLVFWHFHESWPQHVTRYYITMAPGVIYFVLLGTRTLLEQARRRVAADKATTWVRVGALAGAPAVAALVGLALAINVTATPSVPDPAVTQARDSARWLAAQSDVERAEIYSDLWPLTAYYLQRSVRPMPFLESERGIEHELAVNGADYYVTNKDLRAAGYHASLESDGVRVLKRRTRLSVAEPPRILYLGAGWENYLESLADYRVHLVHHEGDYNLEGSAYLDAYDPHVLASHDAVAVFGGKWRDRPGFERRLEAYVRGGGTVVMDASGNLERPYDLNRSAVLETIIDRGAVDRDAEIELSPAFAARHPEIGAVRPAPWVGETGQPWYGATYSALPGTDDLEVLARLDGRPLIAVKRLGSGRVIWVGANLLWHARSGGSPSEARLVRALLEEAIARPARVAESAASRHRTWR